MSTKRPKGFEDIVVFLDPETGDEVSNDPRWAALKMMEAEQAGDDADGDDDPDGAGDYSSWTGKQLTAEVKRRNDERNEEDRIDTSAIKNKAQAVEALEADDAKQSQD